jgi:hypothetical protein
MILHVFDIGGSVESHYVLFLVFVVRFGSRCECKFFLCVLYDVIALSNICLFNTL